MDEENRILLKNNLIKIFHKTTNEELDITTISIQKIIHKNSNTKEPVYRIFHNETCLTKNNKFCVIYKCIICNREITSMLNNITRKINKNNIYCLHCKETDEKSNNHSLILRKIIDKKFKPKKLDTILEKLNLDSILFNDMDDDFIKNYFKRNLTLEEFERIRDKIISIQNDKIVLTDKYIYYPTVKINNQTLFNPYLYNSETDTIEKIQYIKYKCECCNNIFINRDLYIQKNKYKIFCGDCNFTNNIFKIRIFKNCINKNITYQSQFELKFVKFCNENKILVCDGPNIQYYWNNKTRKYRVDFYIPKMKLLIEIKDNHHWHKQNKENGKWDSKLNGVTEYLKNEIQEKKYIVIYPKNYMKEIKNIKQFCNKI